MARTKKRVLVEDLNEDIVDTPTEAKEETPVKTNEKLMVIQKACRGLKMDDKEFSEVIRYEGQPKGDVVTKRYYSYPLQGSARKEKVIRVDHISFESGQIFPNVEALFQYMIANRGYTYVSR